MRSDAHGVQALNVLVRRDGWQDFDLRERGSWHTASVLTGGRRDGWQAFYLQKHGAQHCIAAGGCGVMARWQGTSAGALV